MSMTNKLVDILLDKISTLELAAAESFAAGYNDGFEDGYSEGIADAAQAEEQCA